MDAVGVADEVVVGEVVALAPVVLSLHHCTVLYWCCSPRELPDAAVAHRAEAELLHADGPRALVLARPRPRHRGNLAWYSEVSITVAAHITTWSEVSIRDTADRIEW